MISYKKVFDKAAAEGLEALELYVSEERNLSFSLFRGELDSYNISDSRSIEARGIFEGRFGYATSEKADASTPDYLIGHIKQNARLTNSDDQSIIFKGSEKYRRKNVFSRKLQDTPVEEKIRLAKDFHNAVTSGSDKIREVEVSYEETTESVTLTNSYGLKLTSKANYAVLFAQAVATDDSGETKSGMIFRLITDPDELDVKEAADKLVQDTVSQFGSGPCDSGKYKCVFGGNAFASLLGAFLQNLSSEEVQKNSSLLAGKLGEKVASSRLTVFEKPLEKNASFRYFDDEGVATSNKTLIKGGVLQTYLYNLTTAAKEGKPSTGNGYKSRDGKIGVGLRNVFVKPGTLTEEGLFEKAGEGVYITGISGLHAGMNPQSGNFSLIAQGYMIRDGKRAEPLSLITVAGNLFEVFSQISAVGSDQELRMNGYFVPSVLVRKISVSGK